MRKALFEELRESMNEALEHARRKRELRTTLVPAAPRPMSAEDVRALRDALNASQSVFAKFLNVSPQLVRAWESSRRRPEGAALRLLEVAKRSPAAVFAEISTLPSKSAARAVKLSGHTPKRAQGKRSRSP